MIWGRNGVAVGSDEFEIHVADWQESRSVILSIRQAVFVREQGVPEELEWDGLDPACLHLVAWNRRGEPIGTARMQPDGRIGRMAVLNDWRGHGVGRALVSRLLDEASAKGLSRVCLAAQTYALGFYQKQGFQVVGESFLDAGIPHRMMFLELPSKLPEAPR